MAKKKKKKKDSGFDYKSTSAYKSLSHDEKKLADLQYQVSSGNSKYTQKQLKEALKKAKKDSKGYMKGILRTAEMEVSNQIAQETGDYQSHLDTINENIKEINQDLVTNKDYLSLEEQSALTKQAQDFEIQMENTTKQIADTGTTFSSIGETAKKRVSDYSQGIVESTQRSYNKQIKDLETQASRGNIQAQQQLKDLQRGHTQNIQNIGLAAEKYLGSKKLKDLNLQGYKQLGKIGGQYQEDKIKDINARQMTYFDEAKQASLNF